MLYDFKCKCGNVEEIYMHNTKYSDVQHCSKCNQLMTRQFVPLNLGNISVGEAHYDVALDRVVRTEKDVKEALHVINCETGHSYTNEPVEIKKRSTKLKMTNNELHEVYKALGDD